MLNKDQQAIVDQRAKDFEIKKEAFDEAIVAIHNADTKAFSAALDKLNAMDHGVCEHGRALGSACLACDEIEAELHEYCDICNKYCDDEYCDICNKENK